MLIPCFDFELERWSFEGPAVSMRDLEAHDEHIIHMAVEFPSKWRMFLKSGIYRNVRPAQPDYRSTAVYFYSPDQEDLVIDPRNPPPPGYAGARRLGVRALDCPKDQLVLREMYSLRQVPHHHMKDLLIPDAQKRLYARSLEYIIYMLERGR